MKIAMIGSKGIPARAGGIERHVEELSVELARRGHNVFVFCRRWYVWPIQDYKGVHCIHAPTIKTKYLDAITHTLTSVIKARVKRVDIYHFHGVGPALLSWLPKLISPSSKTVVTFHSVDRHHQKWNAFARAILRVGEWIAVHTPVATITVSRALHKYVKETYGIETQYIPNGTNIPLTEAVASELVQFALKPNQYLMFCARLVRHKGAHILIDAWKTLRKKRPDLAKDMKLAIVGGSAMTDDYVKELSQMSENDSSIVMTGNQNDETLHSLFANAYAVVHPSASEGLPISVLEAMSHGKCVLSSDIPENMELTKEHGLTFPLAKKDELVKQMIMMLEHPELVAAVGAEARTHIAKHYDWKDIAETTEYLYELILLEPIGKK